MNKLVSIFFAFPIYNKLPDINSLNCYKRIYKHYIINLISFQLHNIMDGLIFLSNVRDIRSLYELNLVSLIVFCWIELPQIFTFIFILSIFSFQLIKLFL